MISTKKWPTGTECSALKDDFVSTAYGTPIDQTHYKFTDPVIFLKTSQIDP